MSYAELIQYNANWLASGTDEWAQVRRLASDNAVHSQLLDLHQPVLCEVNKLYTYSGAYTGLGCGHCHDADGKSSVWPCRTYQAVRSAHAARIQPV